MRVRLAALIAIAVVLVMTVILLIRHSQSTKNADESPAVAASTPAGGSYRPSPAHTAASTSDSAPTNVYAHNLLLRKGPSFRIYIRWLRGKMSRARRDVNPSFDDPESFYLDIDTGVIRANVGDINKFLNTTKIANSPLTNITFSGNGNQIKMTATLHKVVPLPIGMTGTMAIAPDNRIQIHVTKLSMLKIPLKGILGGLHLSVSDLFHPKGMAGIQVSGNDIFFDTQTLLPPPHIRGKLTSIRIVYPDLEEIYGSAKNDVARVDQWRNFLRLRDGTIDFGKLTMHHVDIVMIDISKDAWFDLDLAHYQEQFVNGYTRMTPQAGLQIFMPDLDEIPHNKANQNISVEWLKNRNAPPPADVTAKSEQAARH